MIGFSHGRWAVLKAVLAELVRRPNEPAFTPAAFYPGCDPHDSPGRPLDDTLILTGDATIGPRRPIAPNGAMQFRHTAICCK